MDNSKKFLKDQDIKPRISFKGGDEHIVKLLNDKEDKITDESGKEIQGINYLVEENGEQKTFFTSSIGLIVKLAELPENTVVGIKMAKRKGSDGQFRSYFEVRLINQGADISQEEIPVIESNEAIPDFSEQENIPTNSSLDNQEQ